jgi:dienelactone hydrolase
MEETGMKAVIIALSMTLLAASGARAEIVTKAVDYGEGSALLQGKLVFDDAVKEKRPGVLIVHQWMGPTDYELGRARQLAEMGFVAFVADIYGRDVCPKDQKEAAEQVAQYRKDRALLRARVAAGLAVLKGQPQTDATRVAAIGYCFGGGAVLELARSGAQLLGVVSFHGNLDTPNPADAKNIKTKLLVLHGADDPYVPAEQINGFRKEMEDAKVDYRLISYPGAVHAFTIKEAGGDNSKGAAYNAQADADSWRKMKEFFGEIFK